MRFLLNVVVGAVAVWVADLLLDGVSVTGTKDSTLNEVLTYLVIGLILAVVNAVVKPVVKFFAFPFYVLTLGLLSVVVNAAMLELTAWISSHFSLQLEIDQFWWTAIGAALVVTVVTMVLNAVLPDKD
ncbi:phage holin family protein [Angustibacter peucedani]